MYKVELMLYNYWIKDIIPMTRWSTITPDYLYTFKGADKVVDNSSIEIHPTEYLNTINVPNLPPHELNIKVGAPIILLRNLEPFGGMCNGTHMGVARCGGRVVECEILTGKHAG
jgi:hypothetical protein